MDSYCHWVFLFLNSDPLVGGGGGLEGWFGSLLILFMCSFLFSVVLFFVFISCFGCC